MLQYIDLDDDDIKGALDVSIAFWSLLPST